MSKKRMFQVLDEMNVLDIENQSRTVAVSNNLLEVKKVKQGGIVSFGVDEQGFHDLMNAQLGNNDFVAITLIVDRKIFDQISKQRN